MSLSLSGHLINNVATIVALFVVDHALVKPFVVKREHKLRTQRIARWFFIHAAANFFVVLSALNSLCVVLRDPTHSMDSSIYSDHSFMGNASRWPLTIINSVHVRVLGLAL